MQDHYENIYVVIAGSKTFTLRPPWSVHMMHLQPYPVYQEAMGEDYQFTVTRVPDTDAVRWCPVDVDAIRAGGAGLLEQQRLWPRYFQAPPPLEVTVYAGDILYLPAMWYHYVQQDENPGEAAIAVNYWYNMEIGTTYAYHSFLQKLC